MQLEALVEDQVSSVEPPDATAVGAALSETVGAGVGGAGSCVLFPPLLPDSSPPPAPQATRLNTQSNANDRP